MKKKNMIVKKKKKYMQTQNQSNIPIQHQSNQKKNEGVQLKQEPRSKTRVKLEPTRINPTMTGKSYL